MRHVGFSRAEVHGEAPGGRLLVPGVCNVQRVQLTRLRHGLGAEHVFHPCLLQQAAGFRRVDIQPGPDLLLVARLEVLHGHRRDLVAGRAHLDHLGPLIRRSSLKTGAQNAILDCSAKVVPPDADRLRLNIRRVPAGAKRVLGACTWSGHQVSRCGGSQPDGHQLEALREALMAAGLERDHASTASMHCQAILLRPALHAAREPVTSSIPARQTAVGLFWSMNGSACRSR